MPHIIWFVVVKFFFKPKYKFFGWCHLVHSFLIVVHQNVNVHPAYHRKVSLLFKLLKSKNSTLLCHDVPKFSAFIQAELFSFTIANPASYYTFKRLFEVYF
jgi:hypothetical protein